MPRKTKINTVSPESTVEETKSEEVAPVITDVVKKKRGRKPKITMAVPEITVPEPKTIVKKERKANPWIIHCSKVKAENPGVSYREILKLSKLSYKKGSVSE